MENFGQFVIWQSMSWDTSLDIDHIVLGPNSLRCIEILSQCHLFFYKPSKNTFMDDYDGIYNFNGLKYNPFENFDNFWLIIFYGDKKYIG